jgi:hypothetical protein
MSHQPKIHPLSLAGGTVRHKKESGCIFGWWDSETQKGEWVYFWLVGQQGTKKRVGVFLAGGTVRHKRTVDVFLAGGTVRHKKESGCIFVWWDSETQKESGCILG